MRIFYGVMLYIEVKILQKFLCWRIVRVNFF